MTLPNVNHNIQDGALGVSVNDISGLQVKIGVSSQGEKNKILIFSSDDPGKVKDILGTGPLVNAIFDSFSAGANTIYAIRAEEGTAGSIGSINSDSGNTGLSDITASGNPADEYEVVIEILDSGGLNEATFRYSLDGGDTFSAKLTVPSEGDYLIPGTGITITFPEDTTTPSDSYKEGDKWTLKTEAPVPSVGTVGTAIDVALQSNYEFEFIHIVGESDSAMWAALDTKATEAEAHYRFIHFVAEAYGPDEGEDIDTWVNRLLDERSSFSSVRVSVSAGRLEIADPNSGQIIERNGAGKYTGRLSSIHVGRSPGRVKDGSIPGAVEIRPKGINSGHIDALDQAGYITFRGYEGYEGIYVTNGRMMAPEGSDYSYVELRRPMDKACRNTRKKALLYMQDEVEINEAGEIVGLDNFQAHVQQAIDEMADASPKEISSGSIYIPKDQNLLSTSELKGKIRIVPLAIMREIIFDIAYENPFLAR
ncbi:MAG: hypothetical protein PWR10_1540 [Halanaerobiales bacterium]|nr:hypothetical protein [Halanaerobiales bacterium]